MENLGRGRHQFNSSDLEQDNHQQGLNQQDFNQENLSRQQRGKECGIF